MVSQSQPRMRGASTPAPLLQTLSGGQTPRAHGPGPPTTCFCPASKLIPCSFFFIFKWLGENDKEDLFQNG